MTRKKTAAKAARQRYSTEFKQQAQQRAQRDGVAQAAQDLGLQAQQLDTWRARVQQRDAVSEEQRSAQAELAKLRREMARLAEENDFQKNGGVLRQGVNVKYAAIGDHERQYAVAMMCQVLETSRRPSQRCQQRHERDSRVREIFMARKRREGAPRLSRALRCNRRQVSGGGLVLSGGGPGPVLAQDCRLGNE